MDSHLAGPSSRPLQKRNWPPRLYLAVDCGGTKAAAAICDEQCQVIGKGRGGPSNFTDEGLQSFLLSVEDAIKDALTNVRKYFEEVNKGVAWQWDQLESTSQAEAAAAEAKNEQSILEALQAIRPIQVPLQTAKLKFQAAWFGIAGVDSPADVTTLSPHLAKLLDLPFPSARLIVANDTSLLASPITDSSRPDIRSGVVAISGTGSIVMSFKRSKSGMLKVLGRVGGFGWVLGDEGSGYSVGRDAVRKVLDLADRERLARERGEVQSESDSEQEDKDSVESFGGGVSRGGIDFSGFTSQDCSANHIESANYRQMESTKKGSSADATDKTAVEAPYGHLLRDRILQDWGLLSTDELLRAVYFDDAPTTSMTKTFGGVPTIMRSGSITPDTTPSSDAALQSSDYNDSAQPLSQAEPSLNLLPPTGSKIDEEARLRRYSPIPSLSSSPGDSSGPVVFSRSTMVTTNSHKFGSVIKTDVSSVASSSSNADPSSPRSPSERKHRLASLAPLVFHLAFTHSDQLCLDILRSQAYLIALQIRDILQPSRRAKAHLSSHNSVLCLGGGLVGQHRYRSLLLEELRKLDIIFCTVEYVADPATRGAMALSTVQEQRVDRSS